MTRFTITLALLLCAVNASSQVVVNLQAPPPNQIRIEDMWNLVLTNAGEPVEVYLHGTATERSSGLVIDATTSVFTLPRGSKRIRSADVGKVKVNHVNQSFEGVINRLSALPNGSYEICIEVIRASDGSIIGIGCIQHAVLSLTQVILLYPEDSAVLNFQNEEGEVDEEDDSTSITQRGTENNKKNKTKFKAGAELADKVKKVEGIMAQNEEVTEDSTSVTQQKINSTRSFDVILKNGGARMVQNEEETEDSTSIALRGIEKKDIRRGMVIAKRDVTNTPQNEEETEDSTSVALRGIEKKDIRRGMVIAKRDVTNIPQNEEEAAEGSVNEKRVVRWQTAAWLPKRIPNGSFVFSWLPPTPFPQNLTIDYKIKIVEMYRHQTPYDAMQSNPLFFSQDGIRTTSFVYPVAARPFNPGRRYAWQIEVYGNGILLTQSEIQSFEIAGETPQRRRQILRSLEGNVQPEVEESSPGNKQGNSSDGSFHFLPNNEPQRFAALPLFRGYAPFYRNSYFMQTISNATGSSPSPIQIHFAGEVYGETANRQGYGSERNPGYGFARLTPTVSLFGVPFGLNALLTTENSSQKQNINIFTFFYDVNAVKQMIEQEAQKETENKISGALQFLSYFNSLGIGTNYPSYSPLTMYGAPVSGLNLEFNPGQFYFATALQRNQRPINNLAYNRDLYTVRIGIGRKQSSHIFLTGIYSNDAPGSIVVDSTNRTLTPQTNYVLALESKLNLFNDKLTFEGEVAGSMLTRDNRDPALLNDNIPQFLRTNLNPTLSTQLDFAFTGAAKYTNPSSSTEISAAIKMLGPGYKTFGNPFLRTDILELEGKFAQRIINRQVSLALSAKYWRDNIANSKLMTTTTFAPSIQLGLFFKNLPTLMLQYRPNFLSNNASDTTGNVNFTTHLATATTSYTFKIGSTNLSTNLFYMLNQTDTYDTVRSYKLNTINLNGNVVFPFPLVFSFGTGLNYMTSQGETVERTSFNSTVGYTFFERWSNSIGIALDAESRNNRKLSFFISSAVNITEAIIFDLRAEYHNYEDLVTNAKNFNELIGRGTLRVQL